MNTQFKPKLPAWLERLTASKPTFKLRTRCKCGRFCKADKPDITNKLVADMSEAGLYVPARFSGRGQGGAQ